MDSNASRFFRKNKEEAEQEGFKWRDGSSSVHTPTISGLDLPESIQETDESILNEVVGCAICDRGFKI